jgi:hypothetical protein
MALTAALNIDEVYIVSCGVDHGPESHRICHLSMEPDVLVGGKQPRQFRAHNPYNIAQHWNKNQATVKGEDEPGAARSPYGKFEGVESRQFLVSEL